MPSSKFIEINDSSKPSFSLGVTLGRKPTKGQVGIEIEIEGANLPHEDETPAPWAYHVDHSLRGTDNGEYVLAKPIMFPDVPKALEKLWKVFETKKSKIDDSNRTSVHVHLNFQDFHINRLTSFLCLWFALEEPLTEFCGEHRVGNLFCLRAVDAPAIITQLKHFITSDGAMGIPEHFHYAGLNPNALMKYGSIEVRTLRGCSDPNQIQFWIGLLERLYDLSKEFKDPREAVALFSSGGPQSYFDNILGSYASGIRNTIGWSDNQINDAMYRGIRFAQDLAYCRDWDAFEALTLNDDPFGRDPKKMAKKIVAGVNGVTAAPMPEPTGFSVAEAFNINNFISPLSVMPHPDEEEY